MDEQKLKKSIFKRWWFWTGTAILLLIVLSLLWGPLFAWGPKFGYAKENHQNAVLIAKNSADFQEISNIDKIMKDEEQFHGLAYRHKVKIIFTDSRFEWKRFMPYLSFGTGGATLQAGNTIYLNNAKINSHNYNVDGFIKHELSHELLYQNSGLLKAYKMFKQFWIEEGIATYYGGPHDYYKNKEEFLRIFKGANLKPSDNSLLLYDGLKEKGGKVSYTAYRYFFEYMVTQKGENSLKQFIINYANDPKNYEQEFMNAFGLTIQEAAKNFDRDVIHH